MDKLRIELLILKRNIIENTLKEVEKNFDIDHACSCPEWCDCWYNFKMKMLGLKE